MGRRSGSLIAAGVSICDGNRKVCLRRGVLGRRRRVGMIAVDGFTVDIHTVLTIHSRSGKGR